MDMRANSELAGQIAAALDWWREAGVDGDLRDEPQRWIAPAIATEPAASDAPLAAASAAPAAPPAPPAVIDRSTWPQDLDRFAPWRLSEPWLDEGRTSGRVAPRGAAGAELMILVAEPEREDSDTLLSGPRGRLFAAMLAAMGLEPAAAYVASVLPRSCIRNHHSISLARNEPKERIAWQLEYVRPGVGALRREALDAELDVADSIP